MAHLLLLAAALAPLLGETPASALTVEAGGESRAQLGDPSPGTFAELLATWVFEERAAE